tara:strand:- start:168 stop:830 length:663 start_codon:yes stop_codon:yes gene_type:complete
MPLAKELTEFTTSSPTIASYNYTDIINGLGFVVFQGFNSIDDTTASYGLTTNTLFSDSILSQSATFTDTSFTEQLNVDLDSSAFTVPRDVKGTAYVNIPITAKSLGEGDASTYAIVQLFHYDGSTETQMGTDQQTGTVSEPQTAKQSGRVACLKFDISTLQHFAVGDVLRVTVKLFARVTANSGGCGFYNDPSNRAGNDEGTIASPTTKFDVHIPFRINT